jgi:hypothetical protein
MMLASNSLCFFLFLFFAHSSITSHCKLIETSKHTCIVKMPPFRRTQISGHLYWRIAGICTLLKLTTVLSSAISAVPRLRLFEATICRAYYKTHEPTAIGIDGNVPEELCKIDKIQSDLAQLTGWNSFFSFIPSWLTLLVPSRLKLQTDDTFLTPPLKCYFLPFLTVLLVNASTARFSYLPTSSVVCSRKFTY